MAPPPDHQRRHHHRERRPHRDEDDRRPRRKHQRKEEETGPAQYEGRRRHDRPLDVLKESHREPAPTGYVQQWLGQLEDKEPKSGKKQRSSSPQGHREHRLQVKVSGSKIAHRPDVREDEPIEDRRRRHTSSDSSLLQPVGGSPQAHQRSVLRKEDVDDRRYSRSKEQDGARKRKYVSSSEYSSGSPLPLPAEIFEKRKRHKTKEDRYDAKNKKKKDVSEEKAAKKKTKKVKRGDAAKISRAAGEDLIRSFTSNKIAQERLTMRPGTGIFRNGKASSPSRKRGISDLAFSEMDFLSSSKHRPPAAEKEVVTSKSAQKAIRERERTRNEISTYFAPRQPLQTLEPNLSHETRNSALHSEGWQTTVASSEYGKNSDVQTHSPRKRHKVPREQFLGFGTNISSPRKFTLPPPAQEPIYLKPSVETVKSGSSPATSYVSWSVTARSASKGRDAPQTSNEREDTSVSTSPSVFRRRLIESGILGGLDLTNDRSSPKESDRRRQVSTSYSSDEPSSVRRTSSRLSQSPPAAPEAGFGQNQRREPSALRQRQIEAARRALAEEDDGSQKERDTDDAPREFLASKAYVRRPPSAVPRRPATTTPMRQSSVGRVLSRSSLQHETSYESHPGYYIPLSTAIEPGHVHQNVNDAEGYTEHYMDLPPHLTSAYEDNVQNQLWGQEDMDFAAEEQMAVQEHGEDLPAAMYYDGFDEVDRFDEADQLQYDEDFLTAPQDPPQDNVDQNVPHIDTAENDLRFDQPQWPDQMNQYLQTPRGQSYFQQTNIGRPSTGLQSEAERTGLLEEDQLKGFWATRRW